MRHLVRWVDVASVFLLVMKTKNYVNGLHNCELIVVYGKDMVDGGKWVPF